MPLRRNLAVLLLGLALQASLQAGPDAPPADGDAAKPAQAPEPPPPIEGFTLSWTHINTSAALDLNTGRSWCNLNLQGRVSFDKGQKVFGVCNQIELLEARDEGGRDLLAKQPDRNAQARRFYNPLVPNPGQQPRVQSVFVQLGNLPAIPRRLRTLKGRVWVMMTKDVAVHEIEPVAVHADEPVEAAPNFHFKIEAVRQEGVGVEVEYTYVATHDKAPNGFGQSPPLLREFVLIDDQGSEHKAQDRGQRRRVEGNKTTGGGTARFQLEPDRKPAKLRLHVITATQEMPVPFELRDLPMPLPHAAGAGAA